MGISTIKQDYTYLAKNSPSVTNTIWKLIKGGGLTALSFGAFTGFCIGLLSVIGGTSGLYAAIGISGGVSLAGLGAMLRGIYIFYKERKKIPNGIN